MQARARRAVHPVRRGVGRAGLLGVGIALTLVLAPTLAFADAVDDAAAGLAQDSVYVDGDSETPPVDQGAVGDAVGEEALRVAVLPASAGDAGSVADRLASTYPSDTIAVVTGSSFRISTAVACSDDAATTAVADNLSQLQRDGDVTALLVDFAGRLHGIGSGGGCGAATASSGNDGASDGGTSPWVWFAVLAVLALIGGGIYTVFGRKKTAQDLEGRRADVMSYYNRLAADVTNLDAGGNAAAQQALADASERYTSTGALLAEADTPEEFTAARRTVLEGLVAARSARVSLGIDPGPELPDPDQPVGEQLSEAREVTVGDESFQGHPSYTPGASYRYGGGNGIPGGWYSRPFWETALLRTALGGGRRRGYGGGFGRGYGGGFGIPPVVRRAARRGGGGGGGWGRRGGGGGSWGRRGGGGGGGGSW